MLTIFTDDFPQINTARELKELVVKYLLYGSYYIASGSISDRHEKFDQLYDKYHSYADSHSE